MMRAWSKPVAGELLPRRASAPSAPATCRTCCSRRPDRYRGCRPAPVRAACRCRPRAAAPIGSSAPTAGSPSRSRRTRRRPRWCRRHRRVVGHRIAAHCAGKSAKATASSRRQQARIGCNRSVQCACERASCAWDKAQHVTSQSRLAPCRQSERRRIGGTMQRSEHRILTTHAGSLPRPAALTRLFAQRVRGEAVDPAEIEREGRAAVRAIVQKQIETGLDVIDDGEQSRESFVLYMRHRLTGLGGEGTRADACRSRRLSAVQARIPAARRPPPTGCRTVRSCRRRSARWPTRTASAIEAECADFRAALEPVQGPLCRGVPHRAVARHHRVDRAERALRHVRALSRCARRRAAGRIRGDRRQRLPAAARLPRPRARAPHLLPRPPARRLRRLRRAGRRRDQQGAAQHSARQGAAACVLGQLRRPARPRRRAARHPAVDPPGRMSGAFFLPFANPRHAHEFKRVRRDAAEATTSCSSPA